MFVNDLLVPGVGLIGSYISAVLDLLVLVPVRFEESSKESMFVELEHNKF